MTAGKLAGVVLGGGTGSVPARAWPLLVEEARWEGLGGLVYALAWRECAPVAQPAVAALAVEHVAQAASNLQSLGTLNEVIVEIERDGLEMLVLPGATLLDLYPDTGCRPMDDVDVLVRPEHAEAAAGLLRRLGFRQPRDHEELFVRGDSMVDVHTDLVNGTRVRARHLAGWMAPEEVWQRRRRWEVGGGCAAWCLCREDEVLYTAVHALRHSYRRLAWFCDLHRLLGQSLDWGLVRGRAERFNLSRSLAYGLRYLEQEAGAALPEPASALWRSTPLGPVEERLLTRLFRRRPAAEWGEVLWSCSCPGWVARARFLGEFLFPRPQILRQVFPGVPRALLPLTYLLRLGQICRRGAATLAGMAKG